MGTSLTNVPQAPVVRCEQICAYVGEQTFRSPADRIKYPGQWHQSGKKFQLATLATSPSRKQKPVGGTYSIQQFQATNVSDHDTYMSPEKFSVRAGSWVVPTSRLFNKSYA